MAAILNFFQQTGFYLFSADGNWKCLIMLVISFFLMYLAIVKGFEHQLDELYKPDALDVDSDIRVLETMLRWDTASTAEDFHLNEKMPEK